MTQTGTVKVRTAGHRQVQLKKVYRTQTGTDKLRTAGQPGTIIIKTIEQRHIQLK